MAYLGRSPSQGVRNRYYFTASGGETSVSGALTGGTLTFTDGNYVDVNLNGVTLVAGTDYNTSTANTIAGLSALTANDVVEIVVYDVFSVFSGNVNSDFSIGGNLSVTGTVDIDGGAIDGTAIGASSASTGAFTTVSASSTASIVGHASIGVNAVASTRALTVAGATDGSSSTILQLYNSSLASKFSVRDDGFVDINGPVDMSSTLQVDGVLSTSSNLKSSSSSSGGFNALTISHASNTSGDESRIQFKRTTDAGSDREVAAIVADRVGGNDTALVFETNTDGSDGAVERVRITQDGDVGIGTTAPSDALHIKTTADADIGLQVQNDDTQAFCKVQSGGTALYGGNGGVNFVSGSGFATRLHIASGGNVGIGTSSPGKLMHLYAASDAATLRLENTANSKVWEITPANPGVANSGLSIYNVTDDAVAMHVNNSNNLLIGKTADSIANNGISAAGSATGGGHLSVTNDGNSCVTLNRKTSDGTIMSFATDGSTGGSIGVLSDRLCVGQSDVGLFFDATNNTITPFSFDTFDTIDNHIDLGIGSRRFQDIFASNGTIQTSDENEKQNIASLTSTEINAAKAISALFKTYKWKDAAASKGDTARIHTGVIAQEVQAAMSDAGLDAANYAFWCSDTWWETSTDVPAVEAVDEVLDEDGNVITEAVEAKDAYTRIDTYHTADEAPDGATQRTRMGIRYPELLAFIGAATEQRLTDIETRLAALEAGE
jgi:hypothetical protein